MTEKEKKELEKLIKENGYNEELQDTYMREVLGEDIKSLMKILILIGKFK